jgi:hypothetical protein
MGIPGKRSRIYGRACRRATGAALPGETEARAFSRLSKEGYSTEAGATVAVLWAAAERARALLAKRADDLAREGAADWLSKRADIEDRMQKLAEAGARPGEPVASEYARLLREDPAMRDLYRQHEATS